jgi:LmbE family N-acetylglucosaminyl deacetylase
LPEISNLKNEVCVWRRPHFYLGGDALFFLASAQPARLFSAVEKDVWRAIEQPTELSNLSARFGERTDEIIEGFRQGGLVELVERTFPERRRRILVIEPHADDAALSVGGVMWLRRCECAFIVATMASRSNFTRYYDLDCDYFDVRRVMEIRRKESELFAAMIGGDHVEAGMTDAALRYRDADWTLDFFQRHHMSISAAISRNPCMDERARWLRAASKLLTDVKSDEVWIPLGSPHADHELTVNAFLAAMVSNPQLVAERVVRMYQDVPYAAQFPEYKSEMLAALKQAGMVLEPETIAIDEAFKEKLRLVSVYASQFELRAMRGDIEASALSHGSATAYTELLWTVRELPRQLDPSGIEPVSDVVRKRESEALAWGQRNKAAARIRVLLLVPTGQWASDLKVLCEAFPLARFEIVVAPAVAAEVRDVKSDRVAVREVAAGTLAWGLLGLQLVAARPMPTLFLAGGRRLREAGWLSKLWLRSDTLLAASMNSVVRVFGRAQSSAILLNAGASN